MFRASPRSRAICRIEPPARHRLTISLRFCSFMGMQLSDEVVGESGHTVGVTGQPRETVVPATSDRRASAGAALMSQPVLDPAQALEHVGETLGQAVARRAESRVPGPAALVPRLLRGPGGAGPGCTPAATGPARPRAGRPRRRARRPSTRRGAAWPGLSPWLPAGNRTSDRAAVLESNPRRRSSRASSVSFSTRASRRQTQLLCRPRSSATSTWVMPSSRTRA